VLSGLGWLVAGRGAVQAISWVATIYVIRLLQPEDYGIVAVATMLFGLLVILCNAGISSAIIVTKDIGKSKLQEIQGFLLFASTVIGLLHLAAAPLLAKFFVEPRIEPVVRVLSLGFIFAAASIVPRALLTRRMQFKRQAIATSIATLIGTIITVLLAVRGHAFWSLIIGQLATTLSLSVTCTIAARSWLLPRVPSKDTFELIAVGMSITASAGLWYIYTKLDVFIASRLWNSNILGYYTVPLHLARLPAGKVMPILKKVALPSFAKLRDDHSAAAYYFRLSLSLGALAVFPVFFGIASVSPTAVPLVLGEKWIPSTWILFVVCLGMPFNTLTGLFAPLLVATGNHATVLSNTTFALMIFAVTFTVGAFIGPLGLAAAWALSFPVVFVMTSVRSAPKISVNLGSVFAAIRSPLFAASAMLGANMAAYYFIAPETSPFLVLFLQILLGAVVYFATILLIDRKLVAKALATVGIRRATATP
jgi:O-antigen/teichoic acid export membrane protein